MWHDIRRFLELYDYASEIDMALAEASDRLGHPDAPAETVAEKTPALLAEGRGNLIPFRRRLERT